MYENVYERIVQELGDSTVYFKHVNWEATSELVAGSLKKEDNKYIVGVMKNPNEINVSKCDRDILEFVTIEVGKDNINIQIGLFVFHTLMQFSKICYDVSKAKATPSNKVGLSIAEAIVNNLELSLLAKVR